MRNSVVTVGFNSAAHVADALRSVDAQTWPDIEHLVIDGASRDDTLRIVQAHARPARGVLSEPDEGIYDAMNKGIRLATCDVVGLINSDDFYATPQALVHVARAFADPDLDHVLGEFRCRAKSLEEGAAGAGQAMMRLGRRGLLALYATLASFAPTARLLARAAKPLRRRRAAALRAQRAAAIAAHGVVNPGELLGVLRSAGIAQGDLVFAQTSFNDLHTFGGSPAALLQLLRALVGPQGTLLMPAYAVAPDLGGAFVFDPAGAPTYAGIVNELFRRSDDVRRSLHPRHSICGVGPQAETILQGHEHCLLADGIGSPFDRMRSIPGAKLLTLGLPRGHVSFLHWLEDIDPERLPLRLHERRPVYTRVLFPDGTVRSHADRLRRRSVSFRLDIERVASRLSPAAMVHCEHRGLSIGLYPLQALAAELIALRDAGIVHYS